MRAVTTMAAPLCPIMRCCALSCHLHPHHYHILNHFTLWTFELLRQNFVISKSLLYIHLTSIFTLLSLVHTKANVPIPHNCFFFVNHSHNLGSTLNITKIMIVMILPRCPLLSRSISWAIIGVGSEVHTHMPFFFRCHLHLCHGFTHTCLSFWTHAFLYIIMVIAIIFMGNGYTHANINSSL